MQRFVVVMMVCAAVMLGSVSTSSAQGFKGRWGVQPFLSGAVPTGDFGDRADPGFMFGVKLRKNVNYYFSMDLVADFGPKFNVADGAFVGDLFAIIEEDDFVLIEEATGDYSIVRFAVDNNLYIRNNDIRPYISFGLGAYRVSQNLSLVLDTAEPVTVTDSETKAGVALGAGVEIAAGDRTAAVLDFKYHVAQDGFRLFNFGAGVNIYFDAY